MDEEDNLAPTDQGDENRPSIYISEQTRQSISSIADDIEKYIPKGVKDFIVLSPEDLGNLDKIIPQNILGGLGLDRLESKRGAGDGRSYILSFAHAAAHDTDNNGVDDVAYIVLDSVHMSKEENFLSLLTGRDKRISSDALSSGVIPGTDETWRIYTFLHEVEHLHKYDGAQNNFYNEVASDKAALAFLGKETPGIEKAVYAARAIRPFFDLNAKLSGRHATNLNSASLKGDKSLNIPNRALEDRRSIFKDAADISGDFSGMRMFELEDLLNSDDFDQKIREIEDIEETVYSYDIMQSGAFVSKSIEEPIQEARNKIKQALEDKGLSEDKVFQITAELYSKGDFSDDLVQEQSVWEFLEGARTYMPEHFGVSDPDKAFEPPSYYSELETGELKTAPVQLDSLDKH